MRTTYVRNVSLFALSLCALGYGAYSIAPTFLGPRVTVTTPSQYAISTTSGINVTGRADRFSELYINGRHVVTRTDGTFVERALLTPGTNTFVVEALDTFGATSRETLSVVYAPQEATNETARIVPLVETLRF